MRFALALLINAFLFCAFGSNGSHAGATVFFLNSEKYNLIIYEESELESPVTFLKEAFKKLAFAGEITSCSLVIDLPVGTARGNHSYGGICTLTYNGDTKDIMICADIMLGRVNVNISKYTNNSVDALASYVAQYCYGG